MIVRKIWVLCLIAACIGGALGYVVPFIVPSMYSKLFSVAILAGIGSLFTGVKLIIRDKFDSRFFVLNFLATVVIAVIFVFIGDNLGLDLYYVVLLAIGFRLLQDLDIIKLYLFNK